VTLLEKETYIGQKETYIRGKESKMEENTIPTHTHGKEEKKSGLCEEAKKLFLKKNRDSKKK
jgi:hypothetical protein